MNAFCELTVKVTPRSSRNKIEWLASGDMDAKVHVSASPTDGQANAAVCELVAKALRIAKSNVEVTSGQTSRQKRLRIEGFDRDEVQRRIAAT